MLRNNKLRIIFISSGQYPNGGAASNRHLAYSKGLIELGHEVEFILLKKQDWGGEEIKFNEIKFICVSPKASNSLSKIEKIILHFQTIKKAKKTLIKFNKEKQISALILLDPSVSILIPLINQGKRLGLKIFHERTEYPFLVAGKSILGKIDLNIYLKYVIKRFDGIYVITHALKNYFSSLTSCDICIVNMVVESSRFEDRQKRREHKNTIVTYCGTLEGDKDGVPILIKSFAMITNEFPNAKLQLIGSLRNEITKQRIMSLVQDLKIEDRVEFTGFVGREEMPDFLKNSDILALARPNNKQAEGGFPTKLGEYLATGNPVVITNVGEIGLFLKNRINAYIAEPNNVGNFSEKLHEALSDNDRVKIGLEGKKLVYNEFNYLTQAKKLEQFFCNKICINSL
jgi:glycosyltransferase involved in cell wall biosynthesis